MTTMTLAVPNELKQKMDKFKEINWSEVARQSFAQKLSDLQMLQKMKEQSTLSESDAIRLGRKVNKAVAKKWN
ncbi:MAG: hypothetical protein ACMXYE_00960 [Candidatus Woesearchaeota archaeon]